jgi:hypothetical protein
MPGVAKIFAYFKEVKPSNLETVIVTNVARFPANAELAKGSALKVWAGTILTMF